MPSARYGSSDTNSQPSDGIWQWGDRCSEARGLPKKAGDGAAETGDRAKKASDAVSETGDRPLEAGDLVSETGDRPLEMGDLVSETSDQASEAGDWTLETGDQNCVCIGNKRVTSVFRRRVRETHRRLQDGAFHAPYGYLAVSHWRFR